MPKAGTGEVQKKILLLLLGGLTLGLSGSPTRYFRILKNIGKEWRVIERDSLRRAIRSLYQSRLLAYKECRDGTVILKITKEGKEKVLIYKLDTVIIPKQPVWDNKWRLVIFDIPEHQKKARDALRGRLRQIGMVEFQKSVFVHPYPCDDEVDFFIEFYEVRPYVRLVLAETIDTELHLKSRFGLL